eukprot:5452256-Pyramimonas_sp.AAC.2
MTGSAACAGWRHAVQGVRQQSAVVGKAMGTKRGHSAPWAGARQRARARMMDWEDGSGGDQRQRMACVRPGSCCPRQTTSIVILLRM